jgi:hypothetical protein
MLGFEARVAAAEPPGPMNVQDRPEEAALDKARTWLRAEQQKYVHTVPPTLNQQPVTDAALKRLEEQTRFVPTDVPDRVRRGAFSYYRELEATRIARAKTLIRRVAPGPFEDPNYLAILAYQAASIEMSYQDIFKPPTSGDHFSKFLLGTVHDPNINAFARKAKTDGYTIVVLNSGLVDFVYQSAKAVVEALNPQRDASGRSRVRSVIDLKAIQARLDSNPAPVDRLYRTLEAYFFNGYPRASAFEAIPDEWGPVLGLTVGTAERWIIGHEYGHGLAPSLEQAPAGANVSRAAEYFADCQATIATVFSAGKLDNVPPEIPLGGAIFSLACLEIYQRAFNTLVGKELESEAEQTHPKPRDRAEQVINCFREYFDVHYGPKGSFDLEFVLRKAPPDTNDFSSDRREAAYLYANVLLTIWKPVKERLLQDARHKRQLHPMWRFAQSRTTS